MFARRLKTNIAVHIAVLLLLAMLLIDFVTTMNAQRDLIHSQSVKGRLLISILDSRLRDYKGSVGIGLRQTDKGVFENLLPENEFFCALVLDLTGNSISPPVKGCDHQKEIAALIRQAIESGRQQTRLLGRTWGIFWKQRRNIVIAAPLYQGKRIVGGAGVELSLEGIYKSLRHSQKILFVYVIINTAILTFIGFYRLSKMYLQPLHRLVRRAEEYNDDEEILFYARKGDNELNKLSTALNRMLSRISEGKEKLRSTVVSLEKANFDLKQAQNDIIRAEKLAAVGRLSAGIAHEIGNPIGIVIGYLELLKQEDISKEEKIEYIHRTEKEISRIHAIIRQLLDLSRSSPKASKTVSIHEIINDMTTILKVQPLMSKVDLKLNLAAEKNLIVADAEQIRQVFLNLAINAADAIASRQSDQYGELIITTEIVNDSDDEAKQRQPALKIIFADNGPGIPAKHLEYIFDPFYTTKEPGKGTGLGLSVSFMIVEGLGGTIKAFSEEGRGTTMSVYLPLCSGTAN